MSAEADTELRSEIESLGVAFRPFRVERNGLDLLSDLATLRDLRRTFLEIQPEIVLAYTIKPVIWGAIAARSWHNSRFFALITGLGYAMQGRGTLRQLLSAMVVRLYRFALRRAEAVIFQNRDNRDFFVANGIVPAEKCRVVNGSGVNVSSFAREPLPAGPPRFLLIARLLGEKGIREYVHAARRVASQYSDAVFELVGPDDPSPDGISLAEVQRWHDEGVIVYSGATKDVRPFLANAHIYVLPSYHEGMPRTVLEAMATGRPILTTDVSGCKVTVDPGKNGWLVPKANAEALAERMVWFIENRNQWQAMADVSRRMAEEVFDTRIINEQMLEILGIPRNSDNDDARSGNASAYAGP